ncbi:phosphotransferase [Sphingomonas colocasiae]|uniref:Phosphotransferase n=1 Tax=Sphingomonas colocasiae TaxID=1848973 RepID=A0ABS7PT02_9SPHN|nr:phosphotransferase [Sphingomonas colocasiae]MBY8824343.1 phosphotransferase [Sphingomonas colocasiae]
MSVELMERNLPRSFEAFTPDWFTWALSPRFAGVRVAELTRSGERVGTSASCRFEISYADTGSGEEPPASVYVKGGFTEAQLKRYWMVLQQEARFYNELAPEVPMNIPQHYFAQIDDAQQGITMLEDLGSRGVTFGYWGRLSVDQVAALIEQFAAMHAQWLGDPRLPGLKGWEEPQRGFLKYLVRDKHWDELTSRVYGQRLVEAVPKPELIRVALDRMWGLNDAAPRTLVHGDAHGGNMFFEADGRPGTLDFQLCFGGSGMHDVSWLIVSGLSTEDRRAEEGRLLKAYRQAMIANGADMPDFDALWLTHRQQMAHAFVSGACEPIESGPLEMINAAAEVTIAAARDHDVLDALGVVRR